MTLDGMPVKLHFRNVSKRLEQAVREAIDAALATTGDLADEAGFHRVTLARWRSGALRVTPESVKRLATALRGRSERLAELADRLERLAEAEGGDK